jgi:hypothetical protein
VAVLPDPIPWRRTIAERPFVCYRILFTAEATDLDFTSTEALGGRKEPRSLEGKHIWTGISVYDSEEAARAQANYWWPKIGAYIARLEIPVDASILVKQTTDDRSHFTLWGTAQELRACVSSIVSVRSASAG